MRWGNWGCGLVAGLLALSGLAARAQDATLAGYTPGAEVIRIEGQQSQIDQISGVIYAQIKSTRAVRALRMSLLVPRSAERKPAIVYVPGGGFVSADHEKYFEMRSALAAAGFVVAAVEYRAVPDRYPALVIDGKAAVRYLRAHAEQYGIDPARIGVLGDSAGGYLAQMMALSASDAAYEQGDFLEQSSAVQAAASLYGISDLRNIGAGFAPEIEQVHRSPAVTEALLLHGPAFRDFSGASIDSDPAKALAASPMGHLHGSKPPLLLMHGSADTLVSPVQSQQLYQALRAQDSPVSYVLLEGAGHGDRVWYQTALIQRVVDWFRQTLGGPVPGRPASAADNSQL
jgi:acetyl esterase/lipase